jgi:ferric-dicitrate binding protein FerR (iron transport regulator)
MAWIQEQWNNEMWQSAEISSDAVFAKIKKTIEAEQSERLPAGQVISINQKSKTGNQKLKAFFRYAAVFAVAFGLSLLIQRTTGDAPDSGVIAETPPQYNEIIVPYGSKTKVILPDSSTVWLNAGARLKYPAQFDSRVREVFLQGEGFFDVTKDTQHPFVVNTNGINVKVLGTKFNLMAHADDRIIETTLIEGAIEILGVKDSGRKNNLVLEPGQKLILRKETDKYEVHSVQEAGLFIPEEVNAPVKIKSADLLDKANVEAATAWTENKLVFVKERFGDIKIKIERWYGVTIEVKDPEILDYTFTGTFEKQTFEQAMNALSKAASWQFRIDKNNVTVTK